MLIPDVNLLVYAYNSDAPEHGAAREWWEAALSKNHPVGLTWNVMLGFVRIMSSRRVLVTPLPTVVAIAHLRSWLERPQVDVVQPGYRHIDLLESLSQAAGVTGELTSDLHLAAIAIEHQAELHSNDSDFRRFPGLKWRNPLAA